MLKNKVVLVTGSARRVGRAIALEFARQGADLVIHHASPSSESDARSAVDEAKACGVDAIIVTGDQSNPEDVVRMFESIKAHYGRLDVLVNSAANFKRASLLDIDFDEWQEVIGVNLTGPFLLTQQAARLMIAGGEGGVIINIGDNSGLTPWKERPHHSIAKAGLIMLTRVSALALGEHGIRVNCVVPGPVLPPSGEPDSVFGEIAAALPLGHGGNPGNIAQACVFLATNDFVTGAILPIDGGEGLLTGKS